MKIQLAAAAFTAALVLEQAAAQDLPDTMVWTSYGVGSAGYSEASAIADALGKKFNTRVRIQPSGSAIGRLQPVLQERADYGFLGTEAFFVSEGLYDFAAPNWGPHDLRMVAGRPAAITMVTAADAGIETVADARGKRAAFVVGNPSTNVKCEAIIAFGGLTLDDVDVVMFPTFSAAMSALTRNEADFSCTATTTSQMYELAESPRGIRWIPLEADNKSGWDALQSVLPIMAPIEEDTAAGFEEGESMPMASFRYPLITTKATKPADEVYNFLKAMDETYELYKDGTSAMDQWALSSAGRSPGDLPFHEGAVRYLKEIGVWSVEDEEWNQSRLSRLQILRDAWREFAASTTDLTDDEKIASWQERRLEVLANNGF